MAVWLPKFGLDCQKCSDALKLERGCAADSNIPEMWKIGDWEFSRCPRGLVTIKSIEYLNAYIFFKEGFLPNPGGWLDQPLKFIQAMRLIAAEVIKIKEEKD
ncbi:MAG: hypothetical protein PHC29_02110 [Candidatus Omnitrophica bacterium]|nr:hypothetical protein [Candidatus Omnitrophota bacterium]